LSANELFQTAPQPALTNGTIADGPEVVPNRDAAAVRQQLRRVDGGAGLESKSASTFSVALSTFPASTVEKINCRVMQIRSQQLIAVTDMQKRRIILIFRKV